jgi:phosphopantothenoylcysteine decarboxylase/phosphopantothenate--cysteine ligase
MRILVTAGPTREFWDPVRYLSNRSSGKMGYALARAAARRGHAVTLVSGPVALPPPDGVRLVSVVSAADMKKAVDTAWPRTDVLIMAAAVADWRPRRVSRRKLKKRGGPPVLELERTEDILGSLAGRKGNRLVIGFAAETDRVLAEASRKLREKDLDLIVANDVSRKDAGFEVDTNRVALLAPDKRPRRWPLLSKDAVAERLIAWVEARWASHARRQAAGRHP